MSSTSELRDAFPSLLVALMRGVLWREDSSRPWQQLLSLQSRVRDHVRPMGLELEIDETEGYALLRQRTVDDGDPLPRLIPKRPLSYPVSLLLVLLRKKLVEAESSGPDLRVVLTEQDLGDLVRQFLAETTNEARLTDQIAGHIKRVVELGFLRPLRGREGEYEIVRLIKTFVDAQLLDTLLVTYREHAARALKGSEP